MEDGGREEDVLEIAKVILKNSDSSSNDCHHQTETEGEVLTGRKVASSDNKGEPPFVDKSEDTVYSDNILQKSHKDDDPVGQDESELSDDLVGHGDNERDDLVGHMRVNLVR